MTILFFQREQYNGKIDLSIMVINLCGERAGDGN